MCMHLWACMCTACMFNYFKSTVTHVCIIVKCNGQGTD